MHNKDRNDTNPFDRFNSNQSLDNQDSQRQQPFGVVLDLFPSQQTIYTLANEEEGIGGTRNRDKRGLHQANSELDFEMDPMSNDTTQLLYKQQIDQSSTQILQHSAMSMSHGEGTPEPAADAYFSATGLHMNRSRQANLLGNVCRNTVGGSYQ